jgi:hypothetical protein
VTTKHEYIVCPSCKTLTQSRLGDGCRLFVCSNCKSLQKHVHIREFDGLIEKVNDLGDLMSTSEFKSWRGSRFPNVDWKLRDSFTNVWDYLDSADAELQKQVGEAAQIMFDKATINTEIKELLIKYSK